MASFSRPMSASPPRDERGREGAPAPTSATELAEAPGACPRCGSRWPVLVLLTSMTRYYACANCACRWTEAVTAPTAKAVELRG